MFGITALMNAMNRLANALGGLAETAEQVNAATRQRLQLDHADAPVNRLPEPEESNGRKRRS
jgi:hypothetical protein